jgi:hypothetical protein
MLNIFYQHEKATQIQTLHPRQNQQAYCAEKYNVIKENILSILKDAELTHTELMEQLYTNIKIVLKAACNGMAKP